MSVARGSSGERAAIPKCVGVASPALAMWHLRERASGTLQRTQLERVGEPKRHPVVSSRHWRVSFWSRRCPTCRGDCPGRRAPAAAPPPHCSCQRDRPRSPPGAAAPLSSCPWAPSATRTLVPRHSQQRRAARGVRAMRTRAKVVTRCLFAFLNVIAIAFYLFAICLLAPLPSCLSTHACACSCLCTHACVCSRLCVLDVPMLRRTMNF